MCALCRADSGATLLCTACAQALPALVTPCPRCALSVPRTLGGDVGGEALACRACRHRPPPWSRALAAWRYDFPVDRLLQGLKYGGRIALAEPLADGLADAVIARGIALPAGIVPLPLAPARQRARGFNQSQLIAARVARRLDAPLLAALARVRDAGPQAALTLTARAANVHDAFAACAPLRGMHVAIVDDVMTTGATLAAATRAAQAAGAAEVEAWVVARTLP